MGLALAVFGVLSAHATTYEFTGGDSASPTLYRDAANWSPNAIPDLTTANLAQINNGSAVNYVPGGDLVIKNGGELEVTNGGFTQTGGNAYLQLNGNGTIVVDGGTFNQGTASSGPFNVTGTGNIFNMSAGSSIFNRGFAVSTGLTSTISGGTLTSTGGSLVISSTGGLTISGGSASFGDAPSGDTGVYNTQVGTNSSLTLSGGTLTTNGGFTAATGSTTAISNGSTLTGGSGGFTLNAGATYTQSSGSASVTAGDVTFNGSVAVSGGTLSTASGALSGYGSLTVSGGSITTTGAFNANVSTSPASSANVQLTGGSISVGGAGNVATGATVKFSGGTYTSSGGGFVNIGTFTLAGTNMTLHGNFVGEGTSTTISSGSLTLASGEFQFNNDQNYLTGGTVSTPLIVGVNGGGVANSDGTTLHVFNISGGTLNLTGSGFNGIYGGGSSQYLNFTTNSNGLIDFTNGDTLATVKGFISANVIEYNGTVYNSTTGYGNFTFGTDPNGFVTLTDAFGTPAMVPEPATVLAGLLMVGAALPTVGRRLRRTAAPGL